MLRRERAGRVGAGGVPRQVERLTATSTEIGMPLVAALARLGHPRLTAKTLKRFGMVPRVVKRAFRGAREFESGKRVRGVTRQEEAIGRDNDEPATPSIHARPGTIGIIVG